MSLPPCLSVFIYSAHARTTTTYLEVTHKRIMELFKKCLHEMLLNCPGFVKLLDGDFSRWQTFSEF